MIYETTTKSKFESSVDAANSIVKQRSGKLKFPHQVCDAERLHIQVFNCEKCGKLKRFVERI